jgi:cell wall-associated NlpC family hydrolase
MTEEALITKYVGVPYLYLGRDPKKGLDCLGLIINFLQDVGQEVKKYDYEGYSEKWSKNGEGDYFIDKMPEEYMHVDIPHRGDVVLFHNGEGISNHAGVVLTNNRFIHTCKAGTVVNRLNEKQWYGRITGFYRKRNP